MGLMTKTQVPLSSRAFGEIAYWLTTIGLIIALIGLAIYLTAGSEVLDSRCTGELLWSGVGPSVIWERCSAFGEVPHGHWYLHYLGTGSGIAMLGIAICAIADLIAVLSSAILILSRREISPIFGVFAFIVAVIIALAVAGILAIRH